MGYYLINNVDAANSMLGIDLQTNGIGIYEIDLTPHQIEIAQSDDGCRRIGMCPIDDRGEPTVRAYLEGASRGLERFAMHNGQSSQFLCDLAEYMIDELREELHREYAECHDLDFIQEYCAAHRQATGETFNVLGY